MSEKEKYFRIPRYTAEAWSAIYGSALSDVFTSEDMLDEWCDHSMPGAPLSFVYDRLEMLDKVSVVPTDKFTKALIVTLDEKYIDWLIRNDYVDDARSRQLYMGSISEQQASAMLKEHGADHNCEGNLCFLTVLAFFKNSIGKKKSSFILTPEMREKLQKMFAQEFPGTDIYVPPYVLSPKTLEDNLERLESMADEYFTNGTRVTLGTLETQEWSSRDINASVLTIPVYIAKRFDSAVFPMDLWDHDDLMAVMTPGEHVLFEDHIEEGEEPHEMDYGSLEEIGFPAAFKKMTRCDDIVIYPAPVPAEDIEFLIESINDSITELQNEAIRQQNTYYDDEDDDDERPGKFSLFPPIFRKK